MFGIQGALAMFIDFILRQQAEKGIVRQRGDFVDFVRGAETIEEMYKWHPALQRSDMRNQRKILGFLDAAGAEHRAAGLAHGHDVRVIAKDRERVGCHGARGDVQHKRHQLTGEFVQRRDHQQ